MQNSRFVFLLFISSMTYSADDTASLTAVHAIQQRYYMIRRLEKPIKTLMDSGHQTTRLQLTKHVAQHFKHPATHRALMIMEATKSVEPFYALLSDFLSYKFIQSKDFVREILTAFLLMYKELILSSYKNMPHAKELIRSIDLRLQESDNEQTSLLSMVNYVDARCRAVRCSHDECYDLNAILTGHHTLPTMDTAQVPQDVESSLGTIHNLLDQDDMSDIVVVNNMRFYHIQRLLKSMFILSRRTSAVPLELDDAVINSFESPSLQACLSAMKKQQSLAPLFKTWSQFTCYDFINDENQVREFIVATCLVYQHNKQLLIDENSEHKSTNPQDLFGMYEKLSTLPIPDLLDLLDDVVEHYDTLSQEYALKDSSLSWSSWFSKYWWAPPLIIGSLGITLLKHTQTLLFFLK